MKYYFDVNYNTAAEDRRPTTLNDLLNDLKVETKEFDIDREALLYADAIISGYDSVEDFLEDEPSYAADSEDDYEDEDLVEELMMQDEGSGDIVIFRITREDGKVLLNFGSLENHAKYYGGTFDREHNTFVPGNDWNDDEDEENWDEEE